MYQILEDGRAIGPTFASYELAKKQLSKVQQMLTSSKLTIGVVK